MIGNVAWSDCERALRKLVISQGLYIAILYELASSRTGTRLVDVFSQHTSHLLCADVKVGLFRFVRGI